MRKILYTVAKCEDGKLIRAIEAGKGIDYFCPVCESKMVLRKSGNTGKGSKRPHFAHKSLTINCTAESALHFAFKNLLANKIGERISENIGISINWDCSYCGDRHSGNLLKKVASLELEKNLGVCRPDIALLNSDRSVFAVIEIVVTHKPEESTLRYYFENNIILIQIDLKSDEDIDNLDDKIKYPDVLLTCFNPKCTKCGNFQLIKRMVLIDGNCYRCGSFLKAAMIENSNNAPIKGHQHLPPSEFSKNEVSIATSNGVILKTHYSKMANERYLANTCAICNAFVGDFYLFSNFRAPAAYGELFSESIDIGYFCQHCE